MGKTMPSQFELPPCFISWSDFSQTHATVDSYYQFCHFFLFLFYLSYGPYSRAALIPKLNEKRTEIMCQNLFTGRIVQNVMKSSFWFIFFTYHNLIIRLSVIKKILFLSVFYF